MAGIALVPISLESVTNPSWTMGRRWSSTVEALPRAFAENGGGRVCEKGPIGARPPMAPASRRIGAPMQIPRRMAENRCQPNEPRLGVDHLGLPGGDLMLEAAGVEFANGDQPGVRLTKAAAARSVQPAGASDPTLATTAARRKTAKATEKKR
jgi:hypothetical protein